MRQLVLIVGLFFAVVASAAAKDTRVLETMLTLYKGESRVIEAPNAVRLSVGKADLISSTLLKNGEMVLTADEAGETNLQVWFADGHRESLPVVIVESNGWREALEIKQLLKDIPGIKITTVGRRVVVDGNLEARDLARVNTVKDRYDDMLILAREITPYEQKMIYFDVKVTEINRDDTELLGIDWSTTFTGPSLGHAKAWRHNELFTTNLATDDESPVTSLIGATDLTDSILGEQVNGSLSPTQVAALLAAQGNDYTYWGIATSITSIINVLEQTGSALVLAEPRLSARSGGKADLTVGGEVPVVTSSLNGSSVDYKDYGIILGIAPTLDLYNNITAEVSVSISQLDLANAVEGQPAFLKRSTQNDVKLKPGETLALSGLITREEQATFKKVKWLADIPVLGKLFQNKNFIEGTTELVILITPHVVDDLSTGINKQMVDQAAAMVEEFEETVANGLMD